MELSHEPEVLKEQQAVRTEEGKEMFMATEKIPWNSGKDQRKLGVLIFLCRMGEYMQIQSFLFPFLLCAIADILKSHYNSDIQL